MTTSRPHQVAGGAATPVYLVNPTDLEASANVHVYFVDANGESLVSERPNTGVTALRVTGGPTDPISDIPVGIEFDHHQVHEGESHGYSNLVSSLASGSSKQFRINVPAGATGVENAPHVVFEVITTGEAECYLFEGMTYAGGNGGTERASLNRNRLSLTVAGMKIFEDTTPATDGTPLWIGLTGSGNRAGSGQRSLTEWILKPGDYLFRITSRASGCKVVTRLEWYEDLGV